MLTINDAGAGEHRRAFHNAAHRFWQMHQSESFFVASQGMGLEGFSMLVREYSQEKASSLVMQITADPEAAILAALEEWWAGRS